MSAKYYDWNKTLSFDAPITMVCGARGIGKTYGLRMQFIRDYLKDGSRFVAVTRFRNKIGAVASKYFTKLEEKGEFPNLTFKIEGRYAYLSREKDAKGKAKWELFGYFVALTEHQDIKELTFSNVKRIVLDEFILDRMDTQYRRYLPDEWGKMASIIDTVSRERADDESKPPRVYLLGNALSIVNPYFEPLKIHDLPQRGYTWHAEKLVLLHFSDDFEYSQRKATETVAGRMLSIAGQASANIYNTFVISNTESLAQKPKSAHFIFGVVHKGRELGVWGDPNEMRYYINRKIPNNAIPIFSISAEDKQINYRMARRGERKLLALAELFNEGNLFFDTEATRANMLEVLNLYGVRLK